MRLRQGFLGVSPEPGGSLYRSIRKKTLLRIPFEQNQEVSQQQTQSQINSQQSEIEQQRRQIEQLKQQGETE